MRTKKAFASIVMVVALLFTFSVVPMMAFAADGDDTTIEAVNDDTVGTVTDDEAANQGIDRSDLARDDVTSTDGDELETDGTQNITQISADITDEATKTDDGFNWWWLLLLPLAALLAWFLLRKKDDDDHKVKTHRDNDRNRR
jgi:hypothetical protein